MSENSNHIDKLIQQKLDGHKVKAPDNAWNMLRDDLHSPARTRFFWITRSAAAVVLLLIAFGAGYFFSELNREADGQLAGTSEPTEEKLPEIGIQTPDQSAVLETITENDQSITEDQDISRPEPRTDESLNNKIAHHLQVDATVALSDADDDPVLSPDDKSEPGQEFVEDSQDEKASDGSVIQDSRGDLADQLEEPEIQDRQSAGEETQTDVPVMTDEMLREMLISDDDLARGMLLKDDESKGSKWSLGARISPVYSYRSVSGDAFNAPDEAVDAGYFDDNEEGITTIAGGISLDFSFSNRLSLGSGMYFSRIGQQNNDALAFNDPDSPDLYKLATSTGTITVNPRSFENVIVEQAASPKDSIPGDYYVNSSLVQNLDYLEVPLVLKYKVVDSKLSLNVMGGLSPGILVNNRSYFSVEGQKVQTGTTENINNFIYNSILGLGVEYAVTRKVAISMEPSFKYSLTPVNSGTGLEYHPYSLSWFTGISYTLD